jgi:hypothetical protein
MDDSETPAPNSSRVAARLQREAEALRANLRKRKEQQRARDARTVQRNEQPPAKLTDRD